MILKKIAPVWVFERVGRTQVSSEVVSKQNHLFQAHLLPPLLQGRHELLLGPLGVCVELGAAAPAEPQQVQRVDGSAAGQRVQILGPEADAASESVEQNHGRPGLGARRQERR